MTEHIVVIHRWRDRHSRYEDYLDHEAHRISYITTEMARASVPDDAAEVVVVSATDDFDEVLAAAEALTGRFGPPSRIVALNEGDLDTTAELRERLGCAGDHPAQVARFRDKLTMAQAVAAAGIRIPAFADAPDIAAVVAFADEHGWPLIVKPRRGTASRGVVRLDSVDDLEQLRAQPDEPRLVQVFCGDPIYHVDGLWTGTELGPWRASRYLNTCVEFTQGEVLGSVEVADPELLSALGSFAADVGAALGDGPWVFHLEVFVGSDRDGALQLTFLEAGARVGGAEIPFLWREVHGIDLMSAAVAIQLGERPVLAEPPGEREVGGWLLVSTPVPAPCRVMAAELPESDEDGPYAQVVPPVGYRVPKVGGYEHVGARFRFRGTRTIDVEKAILRTAARFRLDCVPERGW